VPTADSDSPLPPPRLRDLLRAGVGIRSIALTVLMLLGVAYTLYFARPVILPVVLALILSLLLAPAVRLLHQKCRVPPSIGAGFVLAALLGTLGVGASFVVEPASAWMQTIPEKIPDIKARLRILKQPFEKVRDASQKVNELAEMRDAGEKPAVSIAPSETPFRSLMTQTPAFVANLFVMFILLYFMLASGDLFLRKLVRMIPSFEDKRRAVEIAREIEDRISLYLRTITVINVCLGTAVSFAAALVGMQNYVFWGLLAFVLNFIPYIGALVGVAATLVVGLLSFESTAYAFLLPAIYIALNTIEGNFITPLIMGRILTLNPVIIFIAIMFWGWIWGIAGALLAVPLLAVLKITCDHLKPFHAIGEFIGGSADA